MDVWLNWLWNVTYGHGLDVIVITLSIMSVVYIYSRYNKHIETLIQDVPAALLLVNAKSGVLQLSNRSAMQILGIRQIGHAYFFPEHIPTKFILSELENYTSKQFQSHQLKWPVTSQSAVTLSLTGRKLLYRGQWVWLLYAFPHQASTRELRDQVYSLSIAKTALDSLSELIYVKDQEGNVIHSNRAYDSFWIGREAEGSREITGVIRGRASKRHWTTSPDGRSCLLETYQSLLMSPEGDQLGVLGISHDVTDWHNIQKSLSDETDKRKDTEVALAKRDTILQVILESSPDSIGIFDENMVYQACNEPFVKGLGLSNVDDLIGHRLEGLIPRSLFERFSDSDEQVLSEEIALRYVDKVEGSDGQEVWYDVVKSPFTEPKSGNKGVLVMSRDISERYLAEQKLADANRELERLSLIDGLTQVSNRRHFDSQLSLLWPIHVREQQPLAVLLCDIDFFKGYNDYYGHQKGDEALKLVAKAFKQVLTRSSDCVARYGGEEFAFILPNTTTDGANHIADKVHEQIRSLEIEHHASNVASYITVSIGLISILPSPEASMESIVAMADSALYQAKAENRNQTNIHPDSITSE
ncbi:diguanylate cyclase [Vibrio sp. ZSDE26]|uniref:diguanylate cyclase n=1 Tax=Vibrio amylolyticus TaxID=2847292 RepID=A0A9X1XMY1_9VIBR|nr:diguanylate cyclase [Vibrio amylolyticus]MCK6262419.1 diguanylate cyclase [Vibrio amylolyticus]